MKVKCEKEIFCSFLFEIIVKKKEEIVEMKEE